MAHQVVWFDIPVRDLDRAIRFYSAVLGAAVKKETFPNYALGILPHAPGEISGCLAPVAAGDESQPGTHGPLLYLNVQGRLDAAISAVESQGGHILQPRHNIGPYGFRAIVRDSEGNRIALHSA